MHIIDEISDDVGIQRGVLAAWIISRSKFPVEDDFVALLSKESIGWKIFVLPRRLLITDAPEKIALALAVPAGDQEPRFPLNRAIWLIVLVDNIFKGSMRMLDPINATGGSA